MRRPALAVFAFIAAASPAFAYDFAMWIPGWGSAQLSSIQTNAGALKESNPVWYGWTSSASLTKKSNAESPTWRAAMTGTLVVPTVQNTTSSGFDQTAVVNMLSNAATRDAHAETLTQLVIAQAYDGIDVDYERIPAAQQANFTAFLTTLSTKLHAIGKKLSVSVYGKVGASDTWDGAGGEDYAAIGRLADSVKIMGYDYHWSTSDPGAIAPLAWLDQVATYAEATIPAAKIMMGLPFYGYDWVSGNGTDVGYPQATQTAISNAATITHDANGEATYTYSGHTVFFQDATSFQAKINMLTSKHPKLGGFTMWAAGQEDPNVWPIVRSTASLGSTAAIGDFAMSGPTNVTVLHGKQTTANYSLVSVNGFTGSATITTNRPAGFSGTIATSGSAGVNSPATLTIDPGDSYPGLYPVAVTFTSGTLVHTLTVNVSVVSVMPASPATPQRHRSASH